MLAEVLVFAGVVAAVLAVLFGGVYWLRRDKPIATQLVLLATAAGSEEARLWLEALSRAGISSHVRNVTDSALMTVPYTVEVWVRPKDKQRAREVLGL